VKKKFRLRHPEKVKAVWDAWYAENKEANNNKTREYRHVHREWFVWYSMIKRCTDPCTTYYEYYGGRGITVCDRWAGENGLSNFMEDMGPRPSKGHSIDRINNDAGYYPENCKWATRAEQARNKRSTRLLTYGGRTLCMEDWAKEIGISPYTIGSRLRVYGWTVEKALTTRPYKGRST